MDLLAGHDDIDLQGRWRGVDRHITARVLGVTWALAVPTVAAFALVFAPPEGEAVAVAAYIAWLAIAVVGMASTLGDKPALGLGALLGLTWIELVTLCVLQASTGGWAAPFYQLIAIHAVIVAASFPATLAAPFILAALLATFLAVPMGDTAGRSADVILHTVVWLGTCGIGLAAMRRVRARRVELSNRARVDELTRLGNRRAFAEAVAHSQASGGVGLVGLGDIDHFKEVNDTFGHLVGDACLRDVAATLLRAADDQVSCFRWAGDEFVVVLAPDHPEALDRRRNAIQSAVDPATHTPDSAPVRLTFGWASADPREDLDAILRKADTELLERKRRGATRDHAAADTGASTSIRHKTRPPVVQSGRTRQATGHRSGR